MKIGDLIDFKKASKKIRANKRKIMTVEFWKEGRNGNFSYVINKHGKRHISDDFAAYGLTCVIEDILAYNEDPCEILELTQEMIIRLGYELYESE